MNSDARRHHPQQPQYGQAPAPAPVYCPAQQSYTNHNSNYDFEQNIDPQLRSSSTARRPHLVPASFPGDDPYIPPDLRQASRAGERSLAPRPSDDQRQWNGNVGAVGANYRRPPSYKPVDGKPQPFNKELYPGYDDKGRRRGLDHLQGTPAPQGVDYYRQRTHEYTAHPDQTPPDRAHPPYHLPPVHVSGHVPYGSSLVPSSSSSSNPLPQAVDPMLLQQPSMGMVASNNQPRIKTLHELLGLDPGVRISLDSLRDPPPGQKPEYTLPTLVKIAILSSPRQALSLQEIYEAIERRFEWFAKVENSKAWKTSIRHSLSLIAAFQKKPRPITDPGKGHYWTVDFSKGDGNKRPRKRNRPPPKTQRGKQAQQSQQGGAGGEASDDMDELSEEEFEDGNIDPALMMDMASGASTSYGYNHAHTQAHGHGGPGPIRNRRSVSHASTSTKSSGGKRAPRPVRKEPYPSQAVVRSTRAQRAQQSQQAQQTAMQVQTSGLRLSTAEYDDERMSVAWSGGTGTGSEYSTPSTNRELSLPPAGNGGHVYDGFNGRVTLGGQNQKDVGGYSPPEYARANGLAMPAPSPTDTSGTNGSAYIQHSPVDQVDYERAVYGTARPNSRMDEQRDAMNTRRSNPFDTQRDFTAYQSQSYNTHTYHQHSPPASAGFLPHSTPGVLPFGAGSNPDAPIPHFGRPRDDIVLVENGPGGLLSARRVSAGDVGAGAGVGMRQEVRA